MWTTRSPWCAGCSQTPTVSGIFNVGTGTARSFRDLIGAMFAALGREPAIEYIDMPAAIRDSYQYFTQAETGICGAPAIMPTSRRSKTRCGAT